MKLGIVLEIAIVLLGVTAPAQAETKRVRIPVSSLPRADKPIVVDAKNAMLPDGARHGTSVPKSWKITQLENMSDEFSHCTDDRRGSVTSATSLEGSTEKIWEKDGKVFFDRARVKVEDGKVVVASVERVPVVYVTESIWAYRNANTLRLITARDFGVFSRAIFWGCEVDETTIAFPTGTTTLFSSADQVNSVIKQLRELSDTAPKIPQWKGVELTVVATVSKASADPEPMLNLVIKRPDATPM